MMMISSMVTIVMLGMIMMMMLTPVSLLLPVMSKGITSHLGWFFDNNNNNSYENIADNNNKNNTCRAIESGIEKQPLAVQLPTSSALFLAQEPRPTPWDRIFSFCQKFW